MTTLKQFAFSGGEVAPAIYGRVDQAKYQTGLRTCRNFIVQRFGSVANRPGTRFITEVKDSTKRVKLIPFIFNAQQTYVLEFGHEYMRVIRNGVQLPSGGPPFELVTTYQESELQELQFVQNADEITIVHPNHPPRLVQRQGDTAWSIIDMPLNPQIASPTGVGVTGTAGANTFIYHVTAVDAITFEESLAGVVTSGALKDPSNDDPHTVTWDAQTEAQEFNIYLEESGVPGFIGTARGTSFKNIGVEVDTTDTPPKQSTLFQAVNDFPSAVGYYQQRLVFANTNNEPEKVFASRSSLFRNFTTSSPIQDDDAIIFQLVGRQVNRVKHLVDLGTLVILTTGGEWIAEGDNAGVLTPTEINSKQQGYNGASDRPPIVVGSTALYVQARGSIVRDIVYNFDIDGYSGNDLTVFSAHLVDRFTIDDWSYQQIPNSVLWMVRSDGALIGLTYVREHQVLGWHRHDTDGKFENVVVVPEGTEDVLYAVVNRTISGVSRRYIERFNTRTLNPSLIEDAVFLDSSLSFDGRNTDATHTMKLSGGTNWTVDETFTLASSKPFFVATDVGNEIHLFESNGDILRCPITAFTDSTSVTVRAHKTVPTALRDTATSSWSRAVDQLSGLSHLEGKAVSVFADGTVVASPNNASYVGLTVSGGSVTLEKPYAVIHIGLPYTSDLETLDIDTTQGETLVDKQKLIGEVTVQFEDSRGLFAGPRPPSDDSVDPLEDLYELKVRNEEGFNDPVALLTGTGDIKIKGGWNNNGRVFLRQVDPVPVTILSLAPSGFMPFRG